MRYEDTYCMCEGLDVTVKYFAIFEVEERLFEGVDSRRVEYS